MGKYLRSQEVGDWDRGFHVLVGEEEVRGRERVRVWLSALVHWCWVVEGRTGRVVCEPRVDGVRYVFFFFSVFFFSWELLRWNWCDEQRGKWECADCDGFTGLSNTCWRRASIRRGRLRFRLSRLR